MNSLILPATFVGNLVVVVLCVSVFMLFQRLPYVSLLAYIGRYSFPIFLLHYGIMRELIGVFWFVKDHLLVDEPKIKNLYSLSVYFLLYPLTITLCILISNLLMSVSGHFKYLGMTKYKGYKKVSVANLKNELKKISTK
jgi:hypothetical protein